LVPFMVVRRQAGGAQPIREESMSTDNHAVRFWDGHHSRRIAGSPAATVNPTLAETAGPLPPGCALDLGCGAGGDALWLAGRGWRVTAVDISAATVRSLQRQASRAGVSVTALCVDLAHDFPGGTFDLVSAQYLHTPFDLDRASVLRTAAEALKPGGRLVVVDHGSAAPWSWNQDPNLHYPTPGEVATELALDATEWSTERADTPRRRATGPAGRTATVVDHVLVIRRAGAVSGAAR
jgi:SAM-dependent methyltransferase